MVNEERAKLLEEAFGIVKRFDLLGVTPEFF